MAIDLQELNNFFEKYASASNMDRGAQAMLAAANAAKPAGAAPLPKMIPSEQQQEPVQDNTEKTLADKDKQIELLKKENEKARQSLAEEQIKSKQYQALQDIDKRQRDSLEKIRQEQIKLDQAKTLNTAEQIKHQATLAKQESDSQVRVQQQKNKALMDLNNQQTQMQMRSADQARRNADRYKDEARKQIDKERAEFDKSRGGLSPALAYTMNNAISALGRLGNSTSAVKSANAGKLVGDLVNVAKGRQNNVGASANQTIDPTQNMLFGYGDYALPVLQAFFGPQFKLFHKTDRSTVFKNDIQDKPFDAVATTKAYSDGITKDPRMQTSIAQQQQANSSPAAQTLAAAQNNGRYNI